ncbi:MAG: hypothetical protein ACRD52_00645 [Candidatus Acidiferrales bacterium]
MDRSDFHELKRLLYLQLLLETQRNNRQLSSCSGKQAFPTRSAAWRYAGKPGLNAYRCPHCHSYHVDRTPTSAERQNRQSS